MALEDLIMTLKTNRLIRSRAEVVAFDEALAAVASQPEREVENFLPELFTVFDDACQQHEVMWGLVHFVEDFDLETMIRAYAQAMPTLFQQAPEWAEILMHGVLNSDTDRAALKRLLPTLSSTDQLALRQVLDVIRKQDDEEAAKVTAVLG